MDANFARSFSDFLASGPHCFSEKENECML